VSQLQLVPKQLGRKNEQNFWLKSVDTTVHAFKLVEVVMLLCLFALLGPVCVKAAHEMLMKLIPDQIKLSSKMASIRVKNMIDINY